MKKIKSSQRGFTLIELLAVIIILGVLLLIAVPSISKYIENSRRNTYVTQVSRLVSSVATSVNALELPFNIGKNEGMIVPFSEINMEKSGSKTRSPYAKFDLKRSFVLVYYDGSKYNYYISAVDEAGYVIPLINEKSLSANSIVPRKTVSSSDLISTGGLLAAKDKVIFETSSVTIKYLNHKDNIIKVSICQTPYALGKPIQLKDGSKWYVIQPSPAESDVVDVVSYYHMNTSGNIGEQSNSKTSPKLQFHHDQSVTNYQDADIHPIMESIVANASVKLSSSPKLNMGSATVKVPNKEDFGTTGKDEFGYLDISERFWTNEINGEWVTNIGRRIGWATADNPFGIRIVIKNLPKSNIDKQATKALTK